MKHQFRKTLLAGALLALGLTTTTSAQAGKTTQDNGSDFEKPVYLKFGDTPMLPSVRMMLPSPAVFDVDRDGKDELVIGTVVGDVFACENSNDGTGDPVWSALKSVTTDDGKPMSLHNWSYVGMTPQQVDLNGDGIQDMVMATFEGTAFWVEGTRDSWKKPAYIVDENDTNVRISTYYDLEADSFKVIDRSSDEYKSVKEHHMTSIAVVDWDQDGDQDLILGAHQGGLYRCMNIGSKTEPRFAAVNHQIEADGEPVRRYGLANPRVVDWNGDGLFDILCGGSNGGVFYYKNVGDKGDPKFASAKELISAKVDYHKKNVPFKDGVVIGPGRFFHIEAVDYDGDGDLDLLVGAESYNRKLSEEEEKEFKEIREEILELQWKSNELQESVEDNPVKKKKLRESDEFKSISEQRNKLFDRMRELEAKAVPYYLIWLYRNRKVSNKVTETTVSLPRKPHAGKTTPDNGSDFEKPVYLKVGDAPMNQSGKMLLPSPAIFDVDQDGNAELVIGSLYGDVFACENSNDGKGEPVWSAPKAVKTEDGQPMRLNNW